MQHARTPTDRPLLGRGDDVTAVLDLIRGGARIVAISGLGGMGKSALAEAVAGACRADGRRPLRIDLSTAEDLDDLLDALAHSIGFVLKDSATAARLDALGRALDRAGPALALLDGFESVQPRATEALGRLSRAAPRLVWLVTTRSALELRSAQQFRLGPLSTAPVAGGALSPAAALFLRRAHQARPSTQLERYRSEIDAIVERLGGIPLAIELAAALAAVLSVPQILDHLHIDLTRRRAGRARGDGVLAAIDWAWQFLEPTSRTAMARLSIFEGPFDFDAALHVLDLAVDEVVDALQELVAASLLVLEESPWSRTGLQYRVLDVVRHHAAARLEEQGRQTVFERYAEYYLEGVAPDDSSVAFDYTDATLRFFAANHHHYTALARRASPEQPCMALRALLRVGCAPHLRDAPERLLGLLAPAIDRCRRAVEQGDRVRIPLVCALLEAAHLHLEVARRSEAGACIDEAQALVEQAALTDLQPCVDFARGMLRVHSGDVTGARAHLDGARAALESRRGHAAVPWIYLYSMFCAEREGAFERSIALGEALLARLEDGESSYMRCTLSSIRACTLFAMGRRIECEACVADGIAAAEKAGVFLSHVRVSTAVSLALFEHAWHRLDVAEHHLVDACARLQPEHPALVRADAHRRLGTLLHEQQRFDEALEAHSRAAEAYGAMAQARIAWSWVAIDLAVVGRAEDAHRMRARAEQYPANRSTRTTCALLDTLWRVVTEDSEPDPPADPTDGRRMPNHVVLLRLIDTAGRRRAASADALWVSADHRRMRPPGADWIDLSRRRVLRALLERFVIARLRRPGVAIDEDALIGAVWPDERRASSLRQRLHANLHNLRALGLRDLLLTADTGWFLDPRVPTFSATPGEHDCLPDLGPRPATPAEPLVHRAVGDGGP